MTTEESSTTSELQRRFETVLRNAIREQAAASGYRLVGVVQGHVVEATLEKNGSRFVLWFEPRRDQTPSYKRTARLQIGYRGEPPDRMGYALIDSLCADIESWERSLPERAHLSLFASPTINHADLELLAVTAGLKPACRQITTPSAVDHLVRDVRARDLHAHVTEAAAYVAKFRAGVGSGQTLLVHVGRTAHAAAAAAEAERRVIDAARRWVRSSVHERSLGAALGYPPCCIDAYLRVRKRPNAEIRFHALRRTRGRAAALLNDLDGERSLLSHFVCRYDCPPSLQYARALLEQLARVRAEPADDWQRALRGLVIMFRQGGAFRLALGGMPSGARYRFTSVQLYEDATRLDRWRAALATADGVELRLAQVRVLRGDAECSSLSASPRQVQIRQFA